MSLTSAEPRRLSTTPRTSDRVFRAIVTAGGLSALVVLALITGFLAKESLPVFRQFGFSFITGFEWMPDDPNTPGTGQFGIGAMLVGTLITSVIALVIALPVAVGLALFLTQYAPKLLRAPLTIVIDLMAAIPSIVYGPGSCTG